MPPCSPQPHAARSLTSIEALAISPLTVARTRAYLDFAGQDADHDGPMFRPLRGNAAPHDPAGQMVPTIDLVVWKRAASIGLKRGYSAQSMRATFITPVLENGAPLKTCRKLQGTIIHPRRSYTTAGAIIPRRPLAFCDLLT
jgi:hypothetical protein